MPRQTDTVPADPISANVRTVEQDQADQVAGERQGLPSLFVCPDCGGTLWQVNEPELIFFRCHVGHTLAGEHLFRQQLDTSENAIWLAIRTLKDRSVLGKTLSEFARKRGASENAADFRNQADEAERLSLALREFVERG